MAAIQSIVQKIGCTAEMLCRRVERAEIDGGRRPGMTNGALEEMKALRRENREPKQASETLLQASAFFARVDLDCKAK
jgi:transposase